RRKDRTSGMSLGAYTESSRRKTQKKKSRQILKPRNSHPPCKRRKDRTSGMSLGAYTESSRRKTQKKKSRQILKPRNSHPPCKRRKDRTSGMSLGAYTESSRRNGDQPLPVIAQASLAGNTQNVPPTLKDPKF
nr:hypothetical protein [Tanacetum cinerariifolium]